jgi:hypothetical protein
LWTEGEGVEERDLLISSAERRTNAADSLGGGVPLERNQRKVSIESPLVSFSMFLAFEGCFER